MDNNWCRLNFDSKEKKPDLDPYVAIDVDEVRDLVLQIYPGTFWKILDKHISPSLPIPISNRSTDST